MLKSLNSILRYGYSNNVHAMYLTNSVNGMKNLNFQFMLNCQINV